MSKAEIPAGFIDVTGVSLERIIHAAYGLSRQRGMGVYDTTGRIQITAEVVEEIIERGKDQPQYVGVPIISMDYVNGRAADTGLCFAEFLFTSSRMQAV